MLEDYPLKWPVERQSLRLVVSSDVENGWINLHVYMEYLEIALVDQTDL